MNYFGLVKALEKQHADFKACLKQIDDELRSLIGSMHEFSEKLDLAEERLACLAYEIRGELLDTKEGDSNAFRDSA
jgi:hypothetical protein